MWAIIISGMCGAFIGVSFMVMVQAGAREDRLLEDLRNDTENYANKKKLDKGGSI